MQIRPILSALRRHRASTLLIALEIAMSCAILCNAVFLIGNHVERIQRDSGLAEQEIVRIRVNNIGQNDDAAALTRADLTALRAMPGVEAAASVNTLPLDGRGRSMDVTLSPEQQPMFEAVYYLGGEQLLDAMGLNLIAGRRFTPDEFVEYEAWDAPDSEVEVSSVIITRSMADALFPGQNPLGKSLYWGEAPITVVGVVERLVQSHGANDPAFYEYSTILPVRGSFGNYLLRVTDPLRRTEVLQAAVDTLKRINPNRLIQRQETVEAMRSEYYRQDREMVWLLVAVIVALLLVTALGIVGLTSFWVSQRRRQIGVRRALGATRGDILRYFQIENFLIVSGGIVMGMLLAYGLNQGLMQRYELARLPAIYLPVGAIVLWLLGQVAVLAPARRAATVSPAEATRSI